MYKNIVITGASRGIGKKIADYLSSIKGYRVINISRGKNNNLKIKNLQCNISNYDEVKKTFKKIKKIDVLINNSGIARFSKNCVKNFDEIIKTNLNGSFYCSIESLKFLKKQKSSSIINISSINAYQAFPNNPGYVSSKGAILSLTKALALDFGKKNIRVNSISPGYINDGMSIKSFKNFKLNKQRVDRMIIKRWGCASDLFGAIEYLISEKSSYVTGQDIVIDGGWISKGL
jgi:NAD(P)-dependent dehydrogenase (short-subunit alcohol dehydrogenase family)